MDVRKGRGSALGQMGGVDMDTSVVNILTEWDIVAARQIGRSFAKTIGFNAVDQARITTVISELARNIYLYAEQGNVIVNVINQNNRDGIQIIAEDHGPGIQNLQTVMKEGYSSYGLGAGLPGVKRLMDEFEIETETDKGTKIVVVKWLS